MENTYKIQILADSIKEKAFDYGIMKPKIPQFISNNLKYSFFDWQKNAFENFLTFQAIKERENPNDSTHLMFNMATRTGKTLLMASTILYYYNSGYMVRIAKAILSQIAKATSYIRRTLDGRGLLNE